MNIPCPFDRTILSFQGTPVEQERCLIRFVKKNGNVDDTPAELPATLSSLLQDVSNLNITKSALRQFLAANGIAESAIGGSLDDPVSRANNNDPAARSANYFVIHDTSTPLGPGQTFDPSFINSIRWTGNRLESLARGRTHVYITRLGSTLTDREYSIPWRATQFELNHIGTPAKGLFLHHELVQPRRVVAGSDADAPLPGFTPEQYSALALCYVASSVRRNQWLIPTFHCVLDLVISGGHDDAQNFDLGAWDTALGTLLGSLTLPGIEAIALGIELETITNKPGFKVPPASTGLLQGIDFDTAESVGTNFVEKFSIADSGGDQTRGIKDASTDPSRCDRILRFPDGTIFFSAKMAIDSDGSPRASLIDPSGNSSTSLAFRDGEFVNAETVPYIVLPRLDRITKEDFIADMGLKIGDFAAVIFKDQITGAFVADEGPFFKIGEASIRIHERLQPATPSPWQTSAKKKIRDSSVEQDVLYFVFPRTASTDELDPANAEQEITDTAMAFLERFKSTGSHV
jgi:hypothetical protein